MVNTIVLVEIKISKDVHRQKNHNKVMKPVKIKLSYSGFELDILKFIQAAEINQSKETLKLGIQDLVFIYSNVSIPAHEFHNEFYHRLTLVLDISCIVPLICRFHTNHFDIWLIVIFPKYLK